MKKLIFTLSLRLATESTVQHLRKSGLLHYQRDVV